MQNKRTPLARLHLHYAMETSSWIHTAHRKARHATILTSPLANQMWEEVSRFFVKEWPSVFGSPFPFVCLEQKGSRACPWHRCWVGWNESLQRSKRLRRTESSRLSYNLPFSTRRRSKNWSLLWAHPPMLRMWSMSPALLHFKEKQDLPQPNMTVASVPLPLVASQDAHASLTSRRTLMLVHYKDLPTPPPLAVLWSTNGGIYQFRETYCLQFCCSVQVTEKGSQVSSTEEPIHSARPVVNLDEAALPGRI